MLGQVSSVARSFDESLDAAKFLAFAAVYMKDFYDRRHRYVFFSVEEWVLVKLSSETYDVAANESLTKKFRQRYAERFEVLERVGRPAYRLDLSRAGRWAQIHPVVSVAHLENSPQGPDPWRDDKNVKSL